MINTDQKQLGEGRVSLPYNSALQSTEEGTQCGNLEAETMEECCFLAFSSRMLSLLSYITQDHLSRSGTIPSGLDPSMSIKKMCRDIFIDPSDYAGQFYINLTQIRVSWDKGL